MAALQYSRGSLDGRLGLERDICWVSYDVPNKGTPPGLAQRWLGEARKCCSTPAATWDDRVHNFVSPGQQVLGSLLDSPLKGVPLGLAKCRDLIAIKIGSPLLF